MPNLPCPLGADCTDDENGSTWKSVDLTHEQSKEQVALHVKFAHQYLTAGPALAPGPLQHQGHSSTRVTPAPKACPNSGHEMSGQEMSGYKMSGHQM